MIEEGGELVKQVETYNKETGEVRITASAHRDLLETTFIMQGEAVSSEKLLCQMQKKSYYLVFLFMNLFTSYHMNDDLYYM